MNTPSSRRPCRRSRVPHSAARLSIGAFLVTATACGGSGKGVAANASTIPPSCARGGPGMTQCGGESESCCISLEVTGGTYYRTYDLTDAGVPLPPADGGPTGEADPAAVSSFRLDKYLVTVGRFRAFVTAILPPDGGAGWLPPEGSGKHTHLNGGQGLSATAGGFEPGWAATDNGNVAPTDANLACDPNYGTWTPSVGANENRPINCVNWWESYAFCIWDGGFLPSEAEWEYAAAGGSQQRQYPWGSKDPGMGSQYAIYGCYFNATGSCSDVSNIAPVGTPTLGAGLWGQCDLAGEFWEWNLDWSAPYVDPCVDCANATLTLADAGPLASDRVLRGGDFTYTSSSLLAAYRSYVGLPQSRGIYNGLRCARAPQ